MNRLMKFWAGGVITQLTEAMWPRRSRIYYMWGWFALIWLGWQAFKALIWFWIVAAMLIGQALQLIMGLLVCVPQLIIRGVRAVRRYHKWQFNGVTTDDVEYYFGYAKR